MIIEILSSLFQVLSGFPDCVFAIVHIFDLCLYMLQMYSIVLRGARFGQWGKACMFPSLPPRWLCIALQGEALDRS